jgi:hypothetical protein
MPETKSASGRRLGAKAREVLLDTLRVRFEANTHRHEGIRWEKVRGRLVERPDKLWSLGELERTGGEPDVVGHDAKTGEYLFCDCSAESPAGRRSLCYDRAALDARKENKPRGDAVELARDAARHPQARRRHLR